MINTRKIDFIIENYTNLRMYTHTHFKKKRGGGGVMVKKKIRIGRKKPSRVNVYFLNFFVEYSTRLVYKKKFNHNI